VDIAQQKTYISMAYEQTSLEQLKTI
jgi:hypothetical protein